MAERDTDADFERDVRRSILLSEYIRHWGMPSERIVSRRGSDRIEVYLFPGDKDSRVARVATVGVSGVSSAPSRGKWELLLVLPRDLKREGFPRIGDFLLDVAVHLVLQSGIEVLGATLPETPLAPDSWRARALFFDEPRGESEELAEHRVGSQSVQLIWVVPVYANEREVIQRKGVDAFDALCRAGNCDLTNPSRDSGVFVEGPTVREGRGARRGKTTKR